MPRVFLITGSSRGLGHALAQTFLDEGEFVVATARDPTALSFRGTTSDNYIPLKLDVTSASDIDATFTAALDKFKRIDVVINNAAFGLIGALETLSDAQIKLQFEVNFFSVAAITRKAVSIMRAQSPPGGRILQMSGVTGLKGFPMLSVLCASKFAVEALTEAVRQEMKPEWGIQLTCVELGMIDTEAHRRSMVYGDLDIGAYDHMDGRAFVASVDAGHGADPMKIAMGVYGLSKMQDPPPRMIAGPEPLAALGERSRKDAETVKNNT